MVETKQPFAAALAVTRAGNLFTTHTAVEAGFDRFAPDQIEHYLGRFIQKLGLSLGDFLALGRIHAQDNHEAFNMAYLAMRGCRAVNAVSRLHGQVSRRLFSPLFPRWPEHEVPIGHVTNGIHVPSWSSRPSTDLWGKSGVTGNWNGEQGEPQNRLRPITDTELWGMRNSNRRALIEFTRRRLSRDWAMAGMPLETIETARQILDPSILTVVFARRFASYKRPTLLLSDHERLIRLITNPARPLQLIIAGKAHPADRPGQDMIREWMRFLQRPAVSGRVVFLSDYDMLLTEKLVQGADVWLNTPQRPWEACGTSGMKVLANGGLNLSELDGWWAEQSLLDVGWTIGDGEEHGSDSQSGPAEAERLYDLLENQIAPEFYARDDEDLPTAWLARVRKSMAMLTPQYSADRAVRDYTEQYYLPAAVSYRQRAAHDGAAGAEIARCQLNLAEYWPSLRFSSSKAEQQGTNYRLEVQLESKGLSVDVLLVQVYAGATAHNKEVCLEMERLPQVASVETQNYAAVIPADRPCENYTVRVVPRLGDVAVPLESSFILWQR